MERFYKGAASQGAPNGIYTVDDPVLRDGVLQTASGQQLPKPRPFQAVEPEVQEPSKSRDRLIQLDLGTGKVRSSTVLPEFGLAALTTVGRELWLTTPGGHLMVLTR